MAFVLFVAVLNLAVGYALGRGLGLGDLLALLPTRSPKEAAEDLDDDLGLSQPVQVGEEGESTDEDSGATPADMLQSLTSFRDKLNATSIELKLKKEDAKKFEETACKLQQANHEYLEEAEGAIEHLGQLGAAGDTVADATRDAVAQGSEQVAKMSGEIDGFIEAGLDSEETRSKLISKAAEMRDAATELQESTSVAITEAESFASEEESSEEEDPNGPEPPPEEPATEDEPPQNEPLTGATTLDSVDELFKRLEEALAEADEDVEKVEHLAAIRLDPIEGHENDGACQKTIEGEIERMALQSLDNDHAFLRGEPAMIHLRGDSYEDALQRIDGLRKLVESTTYSHDGAEVKATLTCAIADAKAGDAREQVITQLDEALQESLTGGGNRTYHHDGAFPTAVSAATSA